jgi:hypothetical protein
LVHFVLSTSRNSLRFAATQLDAHLSESRWRVFLTDHCGRNQSDETGGRLMRFGGPRRIQFDELRARLGHIDRGADGAE